MSAATTSDAAAPEPSARAEREMLREEMAIARKYMGRVPWEMVAWGFGNFLLWLSLFPLVLSGTMPLWLGFVISTVCCTLAYLPSHEAQHSIIAAEGTKLRWLNELVGHVSTIPLVMGYRVLWITHRQHHAHANDPERDPDIGNKGDTWWIAAWNGLKSRQFGSPDGYGKCLRESDDPTVPRAVMESLALRLLHFAVLAGMAWSGYAIEAFFLWWLPKQIGLTYILIFLSWAPHHPMAETGRYTDTRAWKSPVGTILSLGMEYHVVHHLFPRIPLFQTGPAYWEMRELLLERGIESDGL